MIGPKLTQHEQHRPEDGLHYVFGWRGGDGPYLLASANAAAAAIQKATSRISDPTCAWTRIAVHDPRARVEVWTWPE